MTTPEKTCHQCGRTGTHGFHTFPAEDATYDGRVVVPAHSIVECTGRTACRRRRHKLGGGAAGHQERMRAYE